jgi:DNA-binding NtrC family response regulator
MREHLPPDMAGKSPERHTFRLPYGLSLDAVEREYILGSLQRNGNNKARTAEVLGVSEKTLYNKLNRYAAEARQQGGKEPGNTLSGHGGPSLGSTSEIR